MSTTLTTGYALSALLGFIGLSRRRLLGSAWYLALLPFYWLLLSVAAWRAVFQLVRSALSLGEDRARTCAHLAPRAG